MANPFVHVELMSTDVGKAKAFYGELFDWKLEDRDTGDMLEPVSRSIEPKAYPEADKDDAEPKPHLDLKS
jgi:predicted enzyme related to lactoylglutathione lyase